MRSAGSRATWLAALAFLGLLQAAWLISSASLGLKLGSAGLLALALARPSWALLVWAGLAPLTTSLAGLAGAPLLGAQLLEIMTVAVLTGVVAHHTSGTPSRLALPALLMGTVALASGLSELPARLMTTTEHPADYRAIARLLFDHHGDRMPPLDPWYFALVVAGGAALAWAAESLTRRQPEVAARVVWCAVLGHAGVAMLNVTRVIGASLRGGDFPASLPGLFLTVREHTQYDVNAAASIFVMVIIAAFGLYTRRAPLALAFAAGAVTVGLWVAGSRVAMVALVVTLAAVLSLRARRSVRGLWLAGATVAAAAGLVGWLAVGYPAGRNLNVPASIASRLVLFDTGTAMVREAPVLGIGVGTFLEESPNYGATALQPILFRSRDNAHNYLLQVTAEQGVVGLVALLAMLAAALWPAIRGEPRRDVLTRWLAAGIVASILTWVSGHPLLETEAALMFWLFAGILAGLSGPPVARPALRWIVSVAVIAIAASIPFRAAAGVRRADLEHLATGVSVWQPAVDGERYRETGAEFSLFLPSGQAVVLPIRSATGSALTVELRIGSRRIDVIEATPDGWHSFRIQTPESDSRYLKINFSVVAPSQPCQVCVRVGKAVRLAPR